MIVTISGTPGSGKSTVAKAVAKELNLKHCSTGDFMREIAAKRKMTLLELSKLAETTDEIDKEIDNKNKELAKQDNFVIDSRLAFHFMPKAIKIFLVVNPGEAAHRIWLDIKEKRRPTEKEFSSESEVLAGILRRQESEVQRYQGYYGIDYLDQKNYDFVLDTTKLTIPQAIAKVVAFIQKK